MQLLSQVSAVILAVATMSIAAPAENRARQLGNLPDLPFCVDGSLSGTLPTEIDVLTCASDQKCVSIADALNLPIVGSVLSGILVGVADELPVGLGVRERSHSLILRSTILNFDSSCACEIAKG